MSTGSLFCSVLLVLAVVGWSSTLTLAFEEPRELDSDAEDALQMLNILYKSREPKDFRKVYDAETGITRMLSFDWSDCGSASDYVHLKSISITPDPLSLPGNLTIAFQWETRADLSAPISLDLKLEKKVSFFWFNVPCDRIPGGCHHNDVCKELSKETCPTGYKTCHCPYKPGVYTLSPTTIVLKEGGVPSGDYRATVWLRQPDSELACVYLKLSIA